MIKLTFYIIRCNMNNNIFTIAQRLQEVKEKTKMAKLLYNFHTHYTNINLVCCLKLITCRDKSEKTFHNRPNSTETEFRKQDLKFYLKKKNPTKVYPLSLFLPLLLFFTSPFLLFLLHFQFLLACTTQRHNKA